MASSLELVSCKENLSDALGDRMKTYLEVLKLWFRMKISREDFDHRARKLLSSNSVHLHNQFLLALLTKCQLLGSSLGTGAREVSNNWAHSASVAKPIKRGKSSSVVKKKLRPMPSSKPSFSRFLPVSPMSAAPQIQPKAVEQDDPSPGFLVREMILPDIGLVHGRLMVTAWDYGLDNVEDDVVRLMMMAIEVQLKNVISAVLQKRNAYKLREGKFCHSVGAQVPQPFLRNSADIYETTDDGEVTSFTSTGLHVPSLKPSIEAGLREASVQLTASSPMPLTKYPVNLFDLYTALKVKKAAIPCHSVYALNMERISNRLWHPSAEEIEQDSDYVQHCKSRQEMFSQKTLMKT